MITPASFLEAPIFCIVNIASSHTVLDPDLLVRAEMPGAATEIRGAARMRPSTKTVGDIIVTIDQGSFNAEPRCDILAPSRNTERFAWSSYRWVERVALLPSPDRDDTKR